MSETKKKSKNKKYNDFQFDGNHHTNKNILLPYFIHMARWNNTVHWNASRKTWKNKMFLRCTHKKVFSRTFVSIREPIKTQPTGSRYYAFTDDTTDEMILSKDNYIDISHRHVSRCYATITSDGLCDSTKHDPDCYKKWISKSK